MMHNEGLLQNYSPILPKVLLSGKNPCCFFTESMRSKEYWLGVSNTAIEDLQLGNRINGKGEKNSIEYLVKI